MTSTTIKELSFIFLFSILGLLLISCSQSEDEGMSGQTIPTKDCTTLYNSIDFPQSCLSFSDAIMRSSTDNDVLTFCIHDIPDASLSGGIQIQLTQYKYPGNAETTMKLNNGGCDNIMEINNLGDEAYACPDDLQFIIRYKNVIILILESELGSPDDCLNELEDLAPIVNAIIDAL